MIDVDSIPRERIPALITALAARLLAEPAPAPVVGAPVDTLVDAKAMAALVDCPESWIRTAARQGRIPCVMVGRYMRFKPTDVQAAITARSS